MHAAQIHAEPETVARASHSLRRNAAHHLVPAELKEDEGIGAERLDDGCNDVDRGRRILCSPGEALGPNANDDVSAVPGGTPGGPLRRDRQGDRFGQTQQERSAAFFDARRGEVHRRRADEACDEGRGGLAVDRVRRSDLLDAARSHDDDAVGQRHRLDLVVRHVDHGRAHPLVQLLDLGAHLDAQLCIEVGQRLVEEENLGVAHDRPAHRDALALAARELARAPLEVGRDVQGFGSSLDAGANIGLRRAAIDQAEGHVLVDGHVRVERVVLEHHGDVAVLGLDLVDDAPVDRDRPAADVLEAGDHAQERGLSAARRADQHHEFAMRDVERKRLQHLERAEGFRHLPKGDRSHGYLGPH